MISILLEVPYYEILNSIYFYVEKCLLTYAQFQNSLELYNELF